jgi:hypothetical protein
MNMKPADFIAATAPAISATILGQINDLIGIVAGLLGIVYLVWRWRREARGGKV